MPVLNRDETTIAVDLAIETAIASLLAANNNLDRVAALRLLVQRVTKRNVTNRTRPRVASAA
jgi:hypothetical protein